MLSGSRGKYTWYVGVEPGEWEKNVIDVLTPRQFDEAKLRMEVTPSNGKTVQEWKGY